MGRIARLLSFVRVERNGAKLSDVKVDPGGGANITAEHFAPAGDDAHPLADDYVVTTSVHGTGREVIVGYADTVNTPKALLGDKRIYARDEDGAPIAEIWLKNTGDLLVSNSSGSVVLCPEGSILGSNANGSFELEVEGDFVVNGVTIAVNGDVTIPASLTLAGKEIAEHDHAITSGSSSPGPTGPNN